MKVPKISVIVPIYNVEPYLRRCLDSLVNQTLKDIEMICINDCSPDNSLAILKEYAEKDERVKIINFEENQGVSIARNAGMDMAKGEYIGVVDPDDYVDLDYYEKLYLKAKEKKSDITYANQKRKKPGQNKEYTQPVKKFGKLYILLLHVLAIYKTDFLHSHSLKYPEKIKSGEDLFFLVQAQFFANKIEFVNDTFYHYIKGNHGASFIHENIYKSGGIPLILDFINKKYTDKEEYGCIFDFFWNTIINQLLNAEEYEHMQKLAKFAIDMYKKRKYKGTFRNIPKFIQESDLENAETLLKKINDNIGNKASYENINTKNLYNRKLYIWGAGANGLDALSQCEKNEWKVDAFLDSNRNLTEFNGYKVIFPQDVLSDSAKDYFIIISSKIYAPEIAQTCKQAGLKEGEDFWRL